MTVKELVEKISELKALELAELSKALEEKFGISPQAFVAAPAAAGGAVEAAEEKTAFTVTLTDGGSQKIQVIKAIREITGKGLKEAKDFVDASPQVVKDGIKKEEAEEIKKKLEAAGAKVELK